MGLRRIFKILLSLVLGMFLCVTCTAETELAAPFRALTLHEYVAELDRMGSAIKSLDHKKPDISKLLQQTPTLWRVQTEQQTFEIPSEWLRSDLIDLRDDPGEGAQDSIVDRLQSLRSEAAAFETPRPNSSKARAQLDSILAAGEFDSVHGPTWLERLKQRVERFLIRLLGRAFASSLSPTLGNVAVYGLIIVAVLLLAYWMYRSIRSSGELETILPYPLPISSKEWTLWMSEARTAADRGKWRDAIHLAYWCGVSFLEAQGLWRPDYARTPREYLRLLPSSSEYHPTLLALTRSFEVVWYGKQEADAAAFSQTLAQLEKLGCH
jgi:hypothetical protein